MRLEIERARQCLSTPLDAMDIAACDALDAAFEGPRHAVEFDMASGDMFFANNRTIAHDRTTYRDDPTAPRLMLRL